MSDWLLLEPGARPWLPGGGASERLVLNEYDIPLMGLVDQGGTTFLYMCLLGELEQLNIWAYVRLEQQEANRLASLQGDQVVRAAARCLSARPVTVALAHDHELQYWLRMQGRADEPLELAARFVRELGPALDSIRKDADDLARLGDLAHC
jgi:hypothetical protein